MFLDIITGNRSVGFWLGMDIAKDGKVKTMRSQDYCKAETT